MSATPRDSGPPDLDLDPTRPHGTPRLGRYELRQRVGYGGMAEVFLACETGAAGLDRWVAIKRIHPGLARQRRFVEMLLDEARIAARIAHPNVAQVLDLGEADGVPYIVMEFLHGQPLSAVITRAVETGGPDVDLMARIVAHAAEGAHAAHELRDREGRPLGIVHRDLSPHNVFVTYDGAVKVVDFGIAKAKGRATMTEPGTLKGKFSYMSPEQGRGAALDRRSDVFALGLVLYEATTGERVFGGEDRAVLAQVQVSDIPPPSRGRKSYPAALDPVILRALAREAADRTPSARELGQEIDRVLVARRALTGPAEIASLMLRLFPEPSRNRVGMPAGATPSGASSPGAAPRTTRTKPAPATPPRSRRGLVPLGVAALAGVLAVLLWSFAHHEPALRATPLSPRVEETPREVAAPAPAPAPAPVAAPAPAPVAAPAPAPAAAPAPAPAPARPSPRPRPAAPTPPAGTGTLDVRSDPWAFLSVDGRRLQATPVVALPLPAGAHAIQLVTEDGRVKRMRVTVTPGRPTRLDVRF